MCGLAARMQGAIGIKELLREAERAIQSVFHQMMKREGVSLAVHTSKKNREGVKTRIAVLVSALENTYRSRPE